MRLNVAFSCSYSGTYRPNSRTEGSHHVRRLPKLWPGNYYVNQWKGDRLDVRTISHFGRDLSRVAAPVEHRTAQLQAALADSRRAGRTGGGVDVRTNKARGVTKSDNERLEAATHRT